MGIGVLIAAHEELTGQVHPELLVLAGALLGGPGAAAMVSLLIRGKQEIPDTQESSSSSPLRS